MKPIVSICCLSYNHQAFITQALEGFLMQETDFAYKIIIHDDASTDGTREIISDYTARYPKKITPIYQAANQYSLARIYPYLAAYRKATGEYIAECDADDYWTDPLKLQKQVEFMDQNPSYSMCYHDYLILKDGAFTIPSDADPEDYTAEELIAFKNQGYGIASNTKLWRNVLTPAHHHYFQNLCPDYVLNVVMGMHGGCKYIPGIKPSVYRKHPGNTWSGTPGTRERAREMGQRLNAAIEKSGNQQHIALRRGCDVNG